MIPPGGIMIVRDSPLLMGSLLFVTAHVVSGLLPDISISKDGRWSVESVSNFLVLNVSIYDGGLLFFDGHLILSLIHI